MFKMKVRGFDGRSMNGPNKSARSRIVYECVQIVPRLGCRYNEGNACVNTLGVGTSCFCSLLERAFGLTRTEIKSNLAKSL